MTLSEREQRLLGNPQWGDVMFGALVEWGITPVLITRAIAWVQETQFGVGLAYLVFAPVIAFAVVGVATGLCSGPAYVLARRVRGVHNRLLHLGAFFALGIITSGAVSLLLLGGWPRDTLNYLYLAAYVLPTGVGVAAGWAIALLRAVHREVRVERTELAALT